ncbi:MAG: hypothetical protein IJ324_08960 [Lachnospiraceae bacterium]|nr:hypothetical protein [Lachnospiraceae bacterium]
MNKKKFLRALARELRKLKREERNKYLEYYDEIISDIVESGVTEEEAIQRQGSITKIAEDILLNTSPGNLKSRDLRGTILVVASLLLLLWSIVPLLFRLQFEMSMSTSIGIIGGADGPTSIFLAGKVGEPWGLYIVTAVVVLTTIVYFMKKHHLISRKMIVVALTIGVVVAVCLLLANLLGKQSTLSTPFGHTFCVEDTVYSQAEEMALNFVATEDTVPLYSFSSDCIMKSSIVSRVSREPWRTLGVMEEVALTEENFDVYFESDSFVSELRGKNKKAWQLSKENGCYYLLQQKNGGIYLAYLDDSFSMRYIVKLSRTDYVTCMMETQGETTICNLEWYPRDEFGINHKQVPLCSMNSEGTLEFCVDDGTDILFVEEKRIIEQTQGYSAEEAGNYNLVKNKDGKFTLNVSCSGEMQNEFAMYYVHHKEGIYVIEVEF